MTTPTALRFPSAILWISNYIRKLLAHAPKTVEHLLRPLELLAKLPSHRLKLLHMLFAVIRAAQKPKTFIKSANLWQLLGPGFLFLGSIPWSYQGVMAKPKFHTMSPHMRQLMGEQKSLGSRFRRESRWSFYFGKGRRRAWASYEDDILQLWVILLKEKLQSDF